jgi:tRNA uridine 5-carbamoylmethylation protein Kti12
LHLWQLQFEDASKGTKLNIDETTSSSVQPAKTKSLESTKWKQKSSEHVSDVELEAASSLAQMSRKKSKKAVKKIVATEVRRVPSVFDDDIFAEPNQKGFSFWPFLKIQFP